MRVLATALAALLPLAAQAEECRDVAEGVDFCAGNTAFVDVEPVLNTDTAQEVFTSENGITLTFDRLPGFAARNWDGTDEGAFRIAETLIGGFEGLAPEVDHPEGRIAASVDYQIMTQLQALVTVTEVGDHVAVIQTTEATDGLTPEHLAAHEAVLAALQEDVK